MRTFNYKPSATAFEIFKKNCPEYKTLTKDQKKFFKAFFTRQNVFLTGEAGTGKSYCIEILQKYCQTIGVFVAKTATTGVAALNIGGQTVHSWAGLGLADNSIEQIKRDSYKNKKARDRILGASVLIVDEISMASADLLNKLEGVMRYVRMSAEPFGGVKIILCGDANQLPFVAKGTGDQLKFFFESESWARGKFCPVLLREQKRQDESSPFYKMLSKLRVGDTSEIEILGPRYNAEIAGHPDPVRIYCLNRQVDEYNAKRYAELNTMERTFVGTVHGDAKQREQFERNCPAPIILKLKIGARVMLLKNVDTEHGLVNGSVGVVKSFTPTAVEVDFGKYGAAIIESEKWELKEQVADVTGELKYKVSATFVQIPLKLCWAVTTHRIQGQTLDAALVDLNGAFEAGQHYVALSRVRQLEHMSVVPFSRDRVKVHPACVEFYKSLENIKC